MHDRVSVVEDAYRSILRRPVDSEGLALFLAFQPGATLTDFKASVEQALAASEEAAGLRYPGVELRTEPQLNDFLAQARSLSYDVEALRTFLDMHWMNLPASDAHPHSTAYREHQIALYRQLSGKAYEVSNERHHFNLQAALNEPYPYNTKNPWAVGDQLIAWGHIIRAMDLSAGASVLELGIGWGSLALQLAQMGCKVTGLDMEQNYLEVVRHRSHQIGKEIEIVQGVFFDVENMSDQYDVILFFESFHHCDDHLRLLDALPRLLKSGGKLVLAGETIDHRLPYPWGLNCSGHAAFAICTHGWLENAFREDYLLDTLAGRGWSVRKHDCSSTATGITYVCTLN